MDDYKKGVAVRQNTLLVLALCSLSCAPQINAPVATERSGSNMYGELTTPDIARVNVDDTLSKFDAAASDILFRYLAGNERWEIQEEGGKKFAVRRERVDGQLKTELNGFYSSHHGGKYSQTRVLLTFSGVYGFGRERGNVTRTRPGTANVPMVVESQHSGSPGNSSYVIVEGSTIGLEIFDQATTVERMFTKEALKEVGKELAAVLTHRDQIRATGVMPDKDFYPRPLPKAASFEVTDGFQTGIYQLDAFVSSTSAGHIETRVFKTATGKQLSAEQDRSRRYVGWSADGTRFFPYNARITVHEGGWNSSYEARFELWHTSGNGTQTKLGEATRMISGWER